MTPSYPYNRVTSQLSPTTPTSTNGFYTAAYSGTDESYRMDQQNLLMRDIQQPRLTQPTTVIGAASATSAVSTSFGFSRPTSAFTDQGSTSRVVPFNLPPILGPSTATEGSNSHHTKSGELHHSSALMFLTAEPFRASQQSSGPSSDGCHDSNNNNVDESSANRSKGAIIINSQEDTKCTQKRTFGEMDGSGTTGSASQLKHLVSPYAIREAEREEKEEAMGASREHPFKGFSSFISMKHMHEKRQCDDRCNSSSNSSTSSASPPSFAFPPANSISSHHHQHHHHHHHSPSPSSPSSSVTSAGQDDLLTRRISNTFISPTTTETGMLASLEVLTEPSSENSLMPARERERLKRPPNAYLLFNRDMRRKLLEVSPKMTVAEISKEIGERWKQLSPEKRETYVRQAALIKQDHLKNHPDFIYTRRSKAELAAARKFSKRKRSMEKPSTAAGRGADGTMFVTSSPSPSQPLPSQEQQLLPTTTTPPPPKRRRKSGPLDGPRDPRGRKKKRHRHPTAPKHPMSGFLFFLAAVRPRVAQQFPGSTVGPISKVIAAQWRDMSDDERIPWLKKAEEDKARYAREMQVYTAGIERARLDETVISDPEDLDVGTVATVVQMVNSSVDPFYATSKVCKSTSDLNYAIPGEYMQPS